MWSASPKPRPPAAACGHPVAPPPTRPPRDVAALPTTATVPRRAALAAAVAAVVPAPTLLPGPAGAAPAGGGAVATSIGDDPAVTDTAFLDVGLCPEGYRSDRALGDANALCRDPAPVGRIVLGLYGDAAPGTVAQFKQLVAAGDLDNTLFHKIVPGEYVAAGRTGSRRMGELAPSVPLPANPDVLTPAAFEGRHLRPGTLSLALGESDDDDAVRLAPGYRPAVFLVTTGPGPVPRLDGANIVFGRVLSGLDVVTTLTKAVPLLKAPPGPWAAVAKLVGDDRAARVAAKYGRPLKLVVITKAGLGGGK